MEQEERLRLDILEISQSRRNVTNDDMLRVLNRLATIVPVTIRDTGHGLMVTLPNAILRICTHHKGSKQIKVCYVNNFLDAMRELGFFEDE